MVEEFPSKGEVSDVIEWIVENPEEGKEKTKLTPIDVRKSAFILLFMLLAILYIGG